MDSTSQENGWEQYAVRARAGLSPDSPLPMYRQVQEFIEASIEAQLFTHRRPLPSSRYLATVLGVSRNTVLTAYQELTALGIVESRPRSGFYPSARTPPTQRVGRASMSDLTDPASSETAEQTPAEVRRDPPSTPNWRKRLRHQSQDISRPGPTHADWKEYPYPFIPGQPDLTSFPVRALSRSIDRALSGTNLSTSIRDSVDQDDPLLLDVIVSELLPPRGIEAHPDEVLITVGAQQGLALVADLMLGQDRTIGMENPGYLDAFQIFRDVSTNVKFVDWMNGELGPLFEGDIDALYLTPSHQHPTTKTMPFDVRRRLLAAADQNDFIIIEDDFDSEIRYVGRPTPALKSMDRTGRVIYIGTFSKFVAPGLRLGFVVADREVIHAMRLLRRHDIKHVSGLLQRGLALYIASGDYQRSLRSQRYLLKQKWESLTHSLQTYLPWAIEDIPTGGISFWVQGNETLNSTELENLAASHGILIDAGSHFYFDSDAPTSNFRLGYNAIPLSRIPAGIHKLSKLIEQLGSANDAAR